MKAITKFIKNYNEWIGLIPLVAAFILIPIFYHSAFGQGGSFDLGLLHVPFTALLMVVVASLGAWHGFKYNFPVLFKYFDDKMEDALLNANPHSRDTLNHIKTCAKHCLFIYLFYFCAILLMQIVLLLLVPA